MQYCHVIFAIKKISRLAIEKKDFKVNQYLKGFSSSVNINGPIESTTLLPP